MSAFRKSPVAARELGISYHQLVGLTRYGKITPPARDSSGDFVWGDADLERARLDLAKMRRPVTREGEHVD
jgi:hypothetical protein